MAGPYRETFTVTRKANGSFQAKLHGYPFFYEGATAEAALAEAGRAMDLSAASYDKATESLRPTTPTEGE